ncbi:hypothetical protein C497_10018 [Halalkalicoccus jeotgali B3]|uniref:DUF4397 domain-containing protein n=1 Tax=Halalkalicoccus jeotgali (strain DSM 18796 / CECT 7217 / JCM 14584 / KCTC 4019 / B3) TaxID=795797 RepID=D8J967_HALJB|nr:hypothetical protein HacjB3_14785 [Halalkalicoccus jeotgali B3]ELY37071.1 hypothetical protein C497_10018 [Halalkalicoccus jeotgali B3]
MVVGTVAGCMGQESGGGSGDSEGQQNETGGSGNDSMENESEGEQGSQMAMVRVAHLSPDAPNVDVYVDGEVVLEDVAYRDVSDYLELQPGTYGVQITAAGDQETVVFDEDVEVQTGAFTLAAVGEIEGESQPFDVLVVEDDLSDPGENARVTALHASPDAPEVDLVEAESGDPLAAGLAFGDTATFEVPEGSYTLEVRPAGGEEAVAEFDVEVAAGTVYSAFAVGYVEPANAPVDAPFELEVVENTQ